MPIIVALGVLCVLSALDRATTAGFPVPALLSQSGFGTKPASAAAIFNMAREPSSSVAAARRVVLRDPLNPSSTAYLGLAYDAAGDDARAREAFTVAAQLGWRNPQTQQYWLKTGIAAGMADAVAQRADAILRTGGGSSSALSALALLESRSDGQTAIAKRLDAAPPWAGLYIRSIASLDPSVVPDRIAVIRLAAGHVPVDCASLAYAAATLVRLQEYDSAANLWYSTCETKAAWRNSITDPSFARATAGDNASPFQWNIASQGGVDARVEETGSGGGSALAVSATDLPARRAVARKLVMLPPGPVTIGWRAVDASGAAFDHFDVSLRCDGTRRALPASDISQPATGEFSKTVNVPLTDCVGQILSVELLSGARDGEVGYIQNLRILGRLKSG